MVTMQEKERLLDKVQKLLALAESENAHEAALAAQKAQELIAKHGLEAALLEVEVESESPADIYRNMADIEGPFLGHKAPEWKTWLAVALAEVNGCNLYYQNRYDGCGYTRAKFRKIMRFVGQKSDVEVVLYMFGYLANEIERLSKKCGAKEKQRQKEMGGSVNLGKTWFNSFKHGATLEVRDRLKQAKREANKQFQQEQSAKGCSLVKINSAIAKVDLKIEESRRWMDKNLNLKKKQASRSAHDSSAYEKGRQAGKSINLGGNRGISGTGNTAGFLKG